MSDPINPVALGNQELEHQSVPVQSPDGARTTLTVVHAPRAHGGMLFLPALGVPARAYLPWARALAGEGLSIAVLEWRGIGSSTLRAGHGTDWGYASLLLADIPAGYQAAVQALPGLPLVWGGHSLGGQMAALSLALDPARGRGLALIASGAPWWRVQRRRMALGIFAAMLAVPPLTALLGHLPGRRLGFGGRESRGLMRDWLSTARTGEYRAKGVDIDLEQALDRLRLPVHASWLCGDLLGPPGALHHLLGKMSPTSLDIQRFDRARLAAPDDHFSWMRSPGPIAGAVAEWSRETVGQGGAETSTSADILPRPQT